jgi:hypothetical protein
VVSLSMFSSVAMKASRSAHGKAIRREWLIR